MRRGLFIVLEGIDGSGKGTQARLLKKFLKKKKKKVWLTSEPTNSYFGRLARKHLKKKDKDNIYLQTLFVLDRHHHLNEILKKIKRGIFVVCDRYFLSSFAYSSLDKKTNLFEELNKKFPLPDLCFYLDISAKKALNRIKKDSLSRELFENKSDLEKVRKSFLYLSQKYACIKINAEQKRESVFQDIAVILEKIIH